MRYFMEYLKTENVNLVKDMGMIPYKLHKNKGFDSTVVTYDYGRFPYLEKEVKGLKIDFVKKIFKSYTLDGSLYLFKNSKNIDMLHIFHVTLSSVAYAFIYKLKNKKGKIYLKLDCSYKLVDKINGLNKIGKKFFNSFLNRVDIVSAEQENLYETLRNMLPNHKHKFICIPNGVDFDYLENELKLNYDYGVKENIILHAAKIGDEEKQTPMLLEAFAEMTDKERGDYKLVLAGPIYKEFQSYIDNYFSIYPNLVGKVIFKGNIENRVDFYNLYRKSKIFCLTSATESFGIVFIEAAAFGNVIVATDVGIAKELVVDGNGALVPTDNKTMLKEKLIEFIHCDELEVHSKRTYEICKEKFNWDPIIDKLYGAIKKTVK